MDAQRSPVIVIKREDSVTCEVTPNPVGLPYRLTFAHLALARGRE